MLKQDLQLWHFWGIEWKFSVNLWKKHFDSEQELRDIKWSIGNLCFLPKWSYDTYRYEHITLFHSRRQKNCLLSTGSLSLVRSYKQQVILNNWWIGAGAASFRQTAGFAKNDEHPQPWFRSRSIQSNVSVFWNKIKNRWKKPVF